MVLKNPLQLSVCVTAVMQDEAVAHTHPQMMSECVSVMEDEARTAECSRDRTVINDSSVDRQLTDNHTHRHTDTHRHVHVHAHSHM